MFRRIVVPLDGSRLAERVLPQAEELTRLNGASLHLVRVADFAQLWTYSPDGLAVGYELLDRLTAHETEMAHTYLSTVQRGLKSRGIPASVEVRKGSVGDELVATLRPGDLLVMGSHGLGGLARWVFGSVADDVVRHAPVPVLVMRLHETEWQPTTTESLLAATGD